MHRVTAAPMAGTTLHGPTCLTRELSDGYQHSENPALPYSRQSAV